jgi:apolipoprotein N-acyltransferase
MHHAQSRLRAIETGRWVVRSANTGVSSVISPTGDAVDTLGALKTGYALADARLSDRTTVYRVVGDIFAYACLAATACAVLCPIGYGMALRILGKRAKEKTS